MTSYTMEKQHSQPTHSPRRFLMRQYDRTEALSSLTLRSCSCFAMGISSGWKNCHTDLLTTSSGVWPRISTMESDE